MKSASEVEVVGAGAIGGLVAWLVIGRITLLVAAPWWVEIPVSALVGGVASFLGVYLLASSDTTQRTRCLAFAMACGLCWKPVVEAATSLVSKGVTQARTAATKDSAEALNKASAPELLTRINEAATAASNLVSRLPEVKDVALGETARRQVGVTINSVESKAGAEPFAAVEALTQVGEAAATANEPGLSLRVVESLAEVVRKAPENPELAKSAVAGLARVESIAQSQTNPALGQQLRAKRNEIERAIR